MTDSIDSPQLPAHLFRRKKEHRRGITYSIMLLGRAGTGKTTFANNLLESSIFPHQYGIDGSGTGPRLNERVTVTAPTKVVSFASNNGLPSYLSVFDAHSADGEPGVSLTSTSLEISTAEDPHERDTEDAILLNLINTHGIGENLDDAACFEEVTSYLEQQFDIVLAEETRIRRNPRFEDTRVHIALYFVEPTGHSLKELDIELMKMCSRYTNVLPIIAKADSLTKEELKQFKQNVNDDISRFNIPVYKFEVDPDDDDLEAVEENEALAALQPFAIVCSETQEDGKYVRKYPWGTLRVDDSNVSDLLVLKNVLFGSHLQEFKDTTQNLLYENYREEKLSSVTKNPPPAAHGDAVTVGDKSMRRVSEAPSLSNFVSLINTGQFKSQQHLTVGAGLPETPKQTRSYSTTDNQGESPIKQMSDEIRSENQEIIDSIKKEARSPGINERNKLRNISETVPYVLRHERIIAKQQKLEELEAQSALELQKRIQELELRAQKLKMREKLLNQGSDSRSASVSSLGSRRVQLKKEDTLTDLASIVSGKQ